MEFSFNVNDIADSGLLKDGTYEVYCESCELKATKDGFGDYIQCELKVIFGPRKGYKITQRFTNRNRSDAAVRIGHQQLSNYCKAIGVTKITNTDQLCNIPLQVEVYQRKRSDDAEKMEVAIKNYLPATQDGRDNLDVYLAEQKAKAIQHDEEYTF